MWSFIRNLALGESELPLEADLSELLGAEDDESDYEETKRSGQITELNADYGLIDGEFYFPSSLHPKIAYRPIRVGDVISFSAKRKDANHQWRVEELLYLEEKNANGWSDDDQEDDAGDEAGNQQPGINVVHHVGQVTRLIGDDGRAEVVVTGVDDNEKKFRVACLKKTGFDPRVGDLYRMELAIDSLDLDDLNHAKVNQVSALRSKTLNEGRVSSWWENSRKGTVDEEVFFTVGDFRPPYMPRVNDVVRVDCIECEPSDGTRKCNWRAVKVVPVRISSQAEDGQQISRFNQPCLVEELIRSKFGIDLGEALDLGTLTLDEEEVMHDLLIKKSCAGSVALISVRVPGQRQSCQKPVIRFPELKLPWKLIGPPASHQIRIAVRPSGFGRFKTMLVFDFSTDDKNANEKFQIGLIVQFEVTNIMLRNMTEQMRPNLLLGFQRSYDNQNYMSSGNRNPVVPGQRKKSNHRSKFIKKRLEEYPVPRNMIMEVAETDDSVGTMDLRDLATSK